MPKILILYHYFYPDDVVSAQHFTQLAEGLRSRGWRVTAMPCNRSCRNEGRTFPGRQIWNGIHIRRVARPPFRQASALGRILNAVWMLLAWGLAAFRRNETPDVVIVGTDPVLSVLAAIPWKLRRPNVRIAHWCFDLYPEAAIADGLLREGGLLVRILRQVLRWAYGLCDLLVDIGPCMRAMLERYQPFARQITLPPWSLTEPAGATPADGKERQALFGDANLALLYSGNLGRAHSFDPFLELARRLRGESIRFAFSVRGNRANALKKAITKDDTNVTLVPFARQENLLPRLSAADVHLVSLRPEWTGLVVPSKFFGSLAVGRPVLFAGSRDSGIAKWIEAYSVGWTLERNNLNAIVLELVRLARDKKDIAARHQHCQQIYAQLFSKQQTIDNWNRALRALLNTETSSVRDSI